MFMYKYRLAKPGPAYDAPFQLAVLFTTKWLSVALTNLNIIVEQVHGDHIQI